MIVILLLKRERRVMQIAAQFDRLRHRSTGTPICRDREQNDHNGNRVRDPDTSPNSADGSGRVGDALAHFH